jgi:hypothetical protein
MEPCLLADCITWNLRDIFSEGLHTSQQWAHMIIDDAPHVSDDNGDDVGGEEEGEEEEEEDKPEQDEEQADTIDKSNKEFGSVISWETDLASTVADWAPTARDHRKAVELLQHAVSESFTKKKKFAALLEGHMTQALQTQLGDLEHIISEHGLIATALAVSIDSGLTSADEMLKLRSELDAFGDEVKQFADEAQVLKEYLLNLILQVLDVARQGSRRALDRISQVEALFGHGIRLARLALVPPLRVNCMSAVVGVDGETPLGTVQVGGCDTSLSAKL